MMPLLFLLFILLPIAELWLIIEIGGAIGVAPTLALLIFDSLVGAMLLRSHSRAAWERFNLALAEGRIPAREVFDGAMIIVGGALLLTPGFITDFFGLALLLPPTRAVVRKLLTRLVGRRGAVAFRVAAFGNDRWRRAGSAQQRSRQSYDYEGSANEVSEPSREIETGPTGGERRG
jgi:UPF0716 protein FxsA